MHFLNTTECHYNCAKATFTFQTFTKLLAKVVYFKAIGPDFAVNCIGYVLFARSYSKTFYLLRESTSKFGFNAFNVLIFTCRWCYKPQKQHIQNPCFEITCMLVHKTERGPVGVVFVKPASRVGFIYKANSLCLRLTDTLNTGRFKLLVFPWIIYK